MDDDRIAGTGEAAATGHALGNQRTGAAGHGGHTAGVGHTDRTGVGSGLSVQSEANVSSGETSCKTAAAADALREQAW